MLSGIQPTGAGFHLGNYLGAVRTWERMQGDYSASYFLADLHAITVEHDPAGLRRRTRESAAELLAAGLDPQRCTVFVQSQLPQHAELGWVLGCLTGFGEASRMTQFKDKSARHGSEGTTVGLFTYPVLQAADILLHQADEVPVGADQRQHLELTRDLARRFNHRFGDTFTVPDPFIATETAKILDLQDPTRQMSKSVGGPGVIWLQDEPAVIRKKIRSAVTDTGREVRADSVDKPGITNLLRIYSSFADTPVAEIEDRYVGRGYGAFKADLADLVVDRLAPIQERYRRWLDDVEGLDAILADGAARAGAVAEATMDAVRDRVGFLLVKR